VPSTQLVQASANDTTPNVGETVQAVATCPAGTFVVGGGGSISGSDANTRVYLDRSFPTGTSGGTWTARAKIATVLGSPTITLTTWAVCLS
jgi:hypothetical protein